MSCHCLCQVNHPDRMVCTGEEDTRITYAMPRDLEAIGETTEVPFCSPCASATALAERQPGSPVESAGVSERCPTCGGRVRVEGDAREGTFYYVSEAESEIAELRQRERWLLLGLREFSRALDGQLVAKTRRDPQA